MKNTIYFIALLFFIVCLSQAKSWAQQVPELSHYALMPEMYSPALVGQQQNTSLMAAYRKQWLDIESAPQSQFLNLQGSPFYRMGVGLLLNNETVHLSRRTQIAGQYAYHILPEGKHQLSLGIYAGLINQGIDFNEAKIADYNDATLFENNQTLNLFDAGAALHYAFQSNAIAFKFNFSSSQLGGILGYNAADYDLETYFRSTASLLFFPNAPIQIEPIISYSDQLRSPNFDEGQLTALLRTFLFHNTFWLTAGIRKESAFLGGFGFKFGSKNNVLLSGLYEIPTDNEAILGSSFELSLGLVFGNKKTNSPDAPLPCPHSRKAYWKSDKQLNKNLNKVSNIAQNASVTSFQQNKKTILLYEFNDDLKHYDLNRNYQSKATFLHIIATLQDLIDDCKDPYFNKIQSINLDIVLKIEADELAYGTNIQYTGEYGLPFTTSYILNNQSKNKNIQKGILSTEELALLKIYDLKQLLLQSFKIKEDNIHLNIRTGQENISSEALIKVKSTLVE